MSDNKNKIFEYYIRSIQQLIIDETDYKVKVKSLVSYYKSLLKELTVNEQIIFTNPVSRIDNISANYNLSKEHSEQIRYFNKISFLYKKNFNYNVEEQHFNLLLVSFFNILKIFITDLPEEIVRIIKNLRIYKPEIQDLKYYERINSKCYILNKSEIKSANEKKYFTLLCESLDDSFIFSLKVFEEHISNFNELHSILRKYSNLNILNITEIVKEKFLFSSNYDTLIILEPDFLVDASSLGSCFEERGYNTDIFLLNKLISSGPTPQQAIGILVNFLMDIMILNPEINPEVEIINYIKENPVSFLFLTSEIYEYIIYEIKNVHYPVLKSVFSRERKTRKFRIEPTFFSPLYGLNGRLDFLTEDVNNSHLKNIFELKTSKPKDNGIWRANRMQIVAYTLILKSIYPPETIVEASLFYSRDKRTPFRNVSYSVNDLKELITARNKIVYNIFILSENKFDFLNNITRNNLISVPKYLDNTFNIFRHNLNSLTDIQSRYYREMLSFVLREYRVAKTGTNTPEKINDNGYASLWLNDVEDKASNFEIIKNLVLKEFNPATAEVAFNISESCMHNFRENDRVIIYLRSSVDNEQYTSEILRGSIIKILPDKIHFKFSNPQLDKEFFSPDTVWIMEHDIIESNYWCTIRALSNFLYTDNNKRDIILGLREPEFEETDYQFSDNLEADQNQSIYNALSAKNYYLLQGPPGTGKTSIALINILKEHLKKYKNSDKKIFLLAYTNRAVDEICLNLEKNDIEFFRFSSAKNGIKNKPLISFNSYKNIILSSKVFVSTASTFNAKYPDFKNCIDTHTLILDEASQLTEPDICGILSVFKKFILIGDQNQLPAIITQSDKDALVKDKYLQQIGISDIKVSYFERIFNRCKNKGWIQATGMLQSHYRMHEKIAGLIKNNYENPLLSILEKQKQNISIYKKDSTELSKLLCNFRIIFVESEPDFHSKVNRDEAKKISVILSHIRKHYVHKFHPQTLGIITTWRAQIVTIQEKIKNIIPDDLINIDTVERYQGSQREIILLSLAVNNEYMMEKIQSLNMLNVDRKLLVALSRAKEQLIILGNREIMRNYPHYETLFKIINDEGIIISTKEWSKYNNEI